MASNKNCKDHLGNEFKTKTEMCDYHGITVSLFYNRKKLGWNLEKILTTPIDTSKHNCLNEIYFNKETTKFIDHKGNQYDTLKDMTKHYKINNDVFIKRINSGWNVEKALTTPILKKQIVDHLGNVYEDRKSLCDAYNITIAAYKYRFKKRWTLEKILTTPIKKHESDHALGVCISCADHFGNTFSSIVELCNAYNISVSAYNYRISHGWTLEKTLTIPVKSFKTKDHLGNDFNSKAEMLKFYGINECSYENRLKRGWSLEDTLTIDSSYKRLIKDHLGNSYRNISELCNAYNISVFEYKKRLKENWNLEEILTKPMHSIYECKDHLGNTFNSMMEMGEFWGVNGKTLGNRLLRDWNLETALTTSSNGWKVCYDHLGNEFANKTERAKAYGLDVDTVRNRLERGWTLKDALCYDSLLSIGETKIMEALENKRIHFFHNKQLRIIFKELGMEEELKSFVEVYQYELAKRGAKYTKKAISRMRPDFALIENDSIHSFIEFDGGQHFAYVDLFFKTLQQFIKCCNKDQLKNNFSETAGIPLLRIRHDQLDKVEYMVDDLLKNPAKYLTQHNTFLTEEEYWKPLKNESEKLGLDQLASAF